MMGLCNLCFVTFTDVDLLFSGQDNCDDQCPAGYECPSNADFIACPAGQYSALGDATCTACAAGHYTTTTGTPPTKLVLVFIPIIRSFSCSFVVM